jgi:hypothetical protein
MSNYFIVPANRPAHEIIREDLIRAHTELVEFENAMSERGKCESRHTVSGPAACTHRAISLTRNSCVQDGPKFACSVVTEYTAWGIATGRLCAECKRPAAQCWSVVMLP